MECFKNLNQIKDLNNDLLSRAEEYRNSLLDDIDPDLDYDQKCEKRVEIKNKVNKFVKSGGIKCL